MKRISQPKIFDSCKAVFRTLRKVETPDPSAFFEDTDLVDQAIEAYQRFGGKSDTWRQKDISAMCHALTSVEDRLEHYIVDHSRLKARHQSVVDALQAVRRQAEEQLL